jgi:hypothetical protein
MLFVMLLNVADRNFMNERPNEQTTKRTNKQTNRKRTSKQANETLMSLTVPSSVQN